MSIRTRMNGRVTTARETVEARIEAVTGTIYTEAIYAGLTATFLVTLMSIIVPIVPFFGVITGGVIGGFVAAYATGGLVRGTVHGIIAAAIGGAIFAGFTAGQALILGLVFVEAPTLLSQFGVPPTAAIFSRQPLVALVAILVLTPLFVAFDGAVGGVVGSIVKWLRNRAA
ncbi:MAG TPA: hypothetical protein VFJ06_06295 [Halococcus sp.]|nr:hypothetical protein [Halococcus sp.]